MGLEPTMSAWKADALPLGDTRTGAQDRIRTCSLHLTKMPLIRMSLSGWSHRGRSHPTLPLTKRLRRYLRFDGISDHWGTPLTLGLHCFESQVSVWCTRDTHSPIPLIRRSQWAGTIRQHPAYRAGALPIELHWHWYSSPGSNRQSVFRRHV